ncbi:MAG TPA: tRNA guanosine(34) transglycosylase Tgt, partial [Rhodothermales bacterium]|nr:tRNA guanosine(34) transglycosylase Tgt [Rhodothermales bacterium]
PIYLGPAVTFTLDTTDAQTAARAGRLETAHGGVQTPTFMPVGTVGTVKAVSPRELREDVRAGMILGNTYHLYLRPGLDLLREAGGLHRFMGWDGPILTDSGGFQVFSLAERRKLMEEGVRFQSHVDGSRHLFTPESVVDAQRAIGSDVMMVLDECPPGTADEAYARRSNDLTIRWAERARRHYDETSPLYGYEQALFAIVHGVIYPEIRRASARALVDLDFPGYAIGGLSVGEATEDMYAMIEVVTPELPVHKPRYLMGVGTPANLIEGVARGVDLFDCVMPTRNGRNGTLFTTEGVLNIRNKKWQHDFSPLDPGLPREVAQVYSKAYVRHLFVADEILGLRISSLQNLCFYLWIMGEMRQAIQEGSFAAWRAEWGPRVSRKL